MDISTDIIITQKGKKRKSSTKKQGKPCKKERKRNTSKRYTGVYRLTLNDTQTQNSKTCNKIKTDAKKDEKMSPNIFQKLLQILKKYGIMYTVYFPGTKTQDDLMKFVG